MELNAVAINTGGLSLTWQCSKIPNDLVGSPRQSAHAWARVEGAWSLSALSGLSLIKQDSDDVFWHFIKAFFIPITDSNIGGCHNLSCVTATSDTTSDRQ